MEWTDEGVILGTRRHGESGAIVELITAAHGRHLGLVRGGRSRRQQVLLQPGNSVQVRWRARLEEHLGIFNLEPSTLRAAAIMESPRALYGLAVLAAHLRLLPERDPHPELYVRFLRTLDALGEPGAGETALARFELALLADLGFGLDLSECAATGASQELVWVSPRTGRAISRSAGEPYRDRLLALPGFLRLEGDGSTDPADLAAAFRLTGHFLELHVHGPRGIELPPERQRLVDAVKGRAVR